MPPRVTYWTGTWDPSREALSKEIAALRPVAAPPAPVISFSPAQRSGLLPQDRVLRLSGRRWLTLRAVAAVVERWGEVSHVFGGLQSWHHLRALGRRPILLTAAIPACSLDRRTIQRVTFFAAETDTLADELRCAGVPSSCIEVVYPGVDLVEFRPSPTPPMAPFRVLFASSPADPREFEARGIPLLVETARRVPDMEFLFLWRQWGDVAGAEKAFRELRPPENAKITHRGRARMTDVYGAVHAVAACYVPGYGKSAPNSVIEGLACGRPALLTDASGLAGIVGKRGAGAVSRADPESMGIALQALRPNFEERSRRARELAEELFAADRFRRQYLRLYEQLRRRSTT